MRERPGARAADERKRDGAGAVAGALAERERPGARAALDERKRAGSAGGGAERRLRGGGGAAGEREQAGSDEGGEPVGAVGAARGEGSAVRAVPASETAERAAIGRRSGAAGTGGKVANPVRKRRLRQTALPVVAAGVAAFVVGTGYLALSDRQPSSDLGRWGAQAAVVPVTVAGRGAGNPFGQATTVPAGAPSRLRVKAIGLDTSLEKLHLGADGVLVPPRGYGAAGWYADGTAPGDTGPAVIAGHVDSKSGPAVFYRLRELTVGDRIEVVRGGTVVRFTVIRTAWYPKTKFPTGEVYGPTPDRQLRLITCGGVFDHRLRSYKDNLVVYAVAG